MPKEAPTGANFAINGHSPFKLEQPNYTPNFPKIVATTNEMAADLMFANPVDVFNDVKSVLGDFRKGLREWARLQIDPVYYGMGVPHGRGETVITQGGLLSTVLHYHDTFKFFGRSGYRPVSLPWGINIGSPKEVGKKLLKKAGEEAKANGRRVKGKGHSLGVYQWMGAFAENPDEFVASVDHLILDGGPWPTWVNKAVETVYLITHPFNTQDEYEVAEIAEKIPLLLSAVASGDLKITSTVSSSDPVIKGIPLGKTYVLQGASHGFLSGHPDSLRVTAFELAGIDPTEANRPNIHQLSLVA